MKLSFQVEPWSQARAECEVLFPAHYAELALNQDRIKLHYDRDKYDGAERAGVAHIVTARCDGQLVGYYFGLLMTHLHYKDAGLMCYTDAYYLRPEFRKGNSGTRFLMAVEDSLRAIGVVKWYLSTKAHQDMGELFERLGLKLSDRMFTKML